jgi:glycosyltransferase involved in cell wall biosynthesis
MRLDAKHSVPVRVLYVLTTLEIGGAERSLLEVVRRLDRDRVDPIICSLISGGALRSAFTSLDIPVVELDVRPGLAETRGARILRVMLGCRPAIIHSRLILSNLWARLGVLVGAKVICEERGLANDRPPLMSVLNRVSQRLCSMNLANSEAVAARMRSRDRIGNRRLRVIYGGVDCARFAPSTEPSARMFDLVTTTRLEAYKGTLDLIAALQLVREHRPETRLSVVGDGSQRAAVEQFADRHGLSQAITFWGEQSDVPARLREGRIFVLSSHEEGLPNAVIEAMACALPVVATRVGGTPEIVRDGETGLLVPPQDPSQLAAAILRYLGDPRAIASHGAAGLARVRAHFNIESSAAAYQRLYLELLG